MRIKMDPLTGKEKRMLRARAHKLKPLVQVGYKGLTDSLVEAVDSALESHELIKVKFFKFKEEKKEIAADIETKTGSQLVGIIGNIATYYREKVEEEEE